MKTFFKNKEVFLIFSLIFLISFLFFPIVVFAEIFEDIPSKEWGKYLELNREDTINLLDTLIQALTTEGIYSITSAASDKEMAIIGTMRKVVKTEVLNHLLTEAPLQVIWGIANNSAKITRLIIAKDISVILDELEKESVKKATEYAIKFFLQNEIRITPGVIVFEYTTWDEKKYKVEFQYVMIYQPVDSKTGKVAIRFYSPNPIPSPSFKGIFYTLGSGINIKGNLPPFIIDFYGKVRRFEFDRFWWIDEQGRRFIESSPLREPVRPTITINFPPEGVPDLGIKPLGFWERNFLKPIKTTIKEVEIIITKVTGGKNIIEDISQIATGVWNTIKSTVSQMKIFGGAGVGQIFEVALQPPPPAPPTPDEQSKTEMNGVEPRPIPVRPIPVQVPAPEPKSLAELQKMLDDIAEQIDILAQKVAVLTENQKQKTEKEEEEIEELVEKEKTKIKEKEVACQPNSININTASKEDLQKIIEVGPGLAQKIIEARPFYSLNDLTRVSRIGVKILQKIIAQGCAYVEEFYAGLAGGGAGGTSQPAPSYPKILISEVQIEGDNKNHDFIELYNPNDSNVDISKYKLRKRTFTGSESSIHVFPSGSIVPAKGYYLWASSKDENYPSLVNADTSTKQTLSSSSSIALLNPNEDIIDALAWGSSTNPFVENAAFPQNPEKGKSLGRKWSTSTENYIDTDNNQKDFEIQTPTPKAQNRSLELEPPPPPPQNLLLNEFFEEWDEPANNADHLHNWNYSGTKTHITRSEDALRGNFSTQWKPITSAENLTQTGIAITKARKYYAEIWIKPLNVDVNNYIRVALDIADPTDGSFPNANFTDYKSEVGWVKLTDESDIEAGKNGGIRIRAQRSSGSVSGPNFLIGAAWLGTAPPPDYWPQGLAPNPVENFQIVSSTNNIITLTWSTATDPDTLAENLSYRIYYSREGVLTENNLTASSTFSTTTSTTTITLSDLYYNSTYYFGIKAFDGQNYSLLSITSPLTIPSAWDSSPWPMLQHDSQRTRKSPFLLENPTNSQVSILLTGETGDYYHLSSIDANGILYLRAKIGSREGIFAFYPDGKEKWFYQTTGTLPSFPALGKDGSIYFYSAQGPRALTPAGNLKWSNNSILDHYQDLDPVLGDNNFYQLSICALTNGSSTDCLVAFNQEDGEIDWFYAIDEDKTYFKSDINFNVTSSVGICSGDCGVTSPTLGTDGTIYFGRKNVLYAIGFNGIKKWQREFGLSGEDYIRLTTPSLDQEGNLYLPVMSSSSTIWGLYAIKPEDSTSTIKWQWQCPGCNFQFPVDFGWGWATPIFGGEVVYQVIQANDIYLCAISSQTWQWSKKGTPLLIDNQGNVYLVFGSRIKAYDKTYDEPKQPIWEVSPGEAFPPVTGIEKISALDQKGNLYLSGKNLAVIKSQP